MEVDGTPEYVFGRMEQTTLAMSLRADLALTPTLSFQVYAQPFVSSGEFADFRRIVDPRARRYEDRFEEVEVVLSDGRLHADLDGDGSLESVRDPRFTVMQFRWNVVLRWEFRPGSTAYLVWTQPRDHFEPDGDFHAGRRFGELFSTRSENVLMLKVSYGLNP